MVIFTGEKRINPNKDNARKYLVRYLSELKFHFDLNDKEIKDIIRDTYISKTKFYKFSKQLGRLFKKKI